MESIIIKYTKNNIKKQNFAISKSIIKYIFENANALIAQKLYRTCKYFFNKNQYFIVDSINFNADSQRFELEYYDDCLDIWEIKNWEEEIKNIWVSHEIKTSCPRTYIRDLFVKICRFDGFELSLKYITLLFKEFKILMKASKNLKSIILYDVYVYVYGNENGGIPDFSYSNNHSKKNWKKTEGARAPLEDIFALVPNVESISIHKGYVTKLTMKKLLSIPWKQKLKKLVLEHLKGPIDVYLYFKFLQKNVISRAETNISFRYKNMNKYIKYFKEIYISKFQPFSKPCSNFVCCLAENWWKDPSKTLLEKEFDFDLGKSFKAKPLIWQEQTFPFHFSLINYIIKTAKGKEMRKLQKSCKYFLTKLPFLIIDDIEDIPEKRKMFQINSYIFAVNEKIWESKYFKNKIWICNKFECYQNLKTIIPKIARFDAIEINLSTSFTLKDMEFLTQTKKIKKWHSANKNEEQEGIENYLCYLVGAEDIRLSPCVIKPYTLNHLHSMPLNKKLKRFCLEYIDSPINIELFHTLLQKSLAPKAYVKMLFSGFKGIVEYDTLFYNSLKFLLQTWKPRKEKPSVAKFTITTYIEALPE